MNDSTLYVHSLLLFMVILVSGSFPVAALITNALPPELMMFLRFFGAAVLFSPFVFIKHGFALPARKTLLGYALLSIPLVVFFWCMFESLRYTSAINTGALYTTVPAITAVFAYIINQEKTRWRRALGLSLGTFGALWIVFRGDLQALVNLNFNDGDLIFLTGCLFMGIYSPLIKKLYAGEPMALMTFWVILIGALWLLLISLNDLETVVWRQVGSEVYLGLLYLAVFTTLGTFFILQLATVKLGPTKVAAYGFLTPVFVIVLSILLGMEFFQWALVPGIFMVLLSMILVQSEGGRNTPTSI